MLLPVACHYCSTPPPFLSIHQVLENNINRCVTETSNVVCIIVAMQISKLIINIECISKSRTTCKQVSDALV